MSNEPQPKKELLLKAHFVWKDIVLGLKKKPVEAEQDTNSKGGHNASEVGRSG